MRVLDQELLYIPPVQACVSEDSTGVADHQTGLGVAVVVACAVRTIAVLSCYGGFRGERLKAELMAEETMRFSSG